MPERGELLRKQFTVETRGVADDERGVELAISTDEVDRDNDTLAADGWLLDNFRRNPVVLWAHDYKGLPIARATRLSVVGGKLRAVAHFVESEILPLADTVLQMLKRGYLNAASVGFAPVKWVRNETRGGIDYIEQELLEFSIVPVPANPGALVARAKAAGIDLAPLRGWAQKFVTDCAGCKETDTEALFALMGFPASGGGSEILTPEQIREMHRELLGDAIDAHIRKRMGRLD